MQYNLINAPYLMTLRDCLLFMASRKFIQQSAEATDKAWISMNKHGHNTHNCTHARELLRRPCCAEALSE